MYCVDCGAFIPPGQVGHFIGGFSAVALCRSCSEQERSAERNKNIHTSQPANEPRRRNNRKKK